MSAEGANWVGFNNRLRCGIYWAGERQPTWDDPSYPVTLEIWAQTNYGSYNNDLTLHYSGSWGAGSNVVRAVNSNYTLMAGPGRQVFVASWDGEQELRTDANVSGPSAGPSTNTVIGVIPRRPTGTPTAPRSLVAYDITPTAASFNWVEPAEWRGPGPGRRYLMQVSERPDYATVAWQGYVGQPYRVSGLKGGTRYYVRVRAEGIWWDGGRYGDFTDGGTFVTMTGVPDPVYGRTISDLTATGFRSGWTPPNGNGGAVTKYQVELRDTTVTSSRTGPIVASGEVQTAYVIFGNLQNKHTYVLHVRAWNGSAWGPWQVDAGNAGLPVTTLAAAPVLSGTPTAQNIARTSFVVPTAAIANNGGEAPTRYRVDVGTSATPMTPPYFELASWSPITVPNRAPLTTYYYRVQAYNSGGWGPWTEWRTVTTLNTAPDDPAAPTITQITETSALVGWGVPPLNNATLNNWTLVISASGSPDAPVRTLTLDPAVGATTVTGLVKGTNYQAFVRANATPTSSGWSPPGAFRTLGTRSTLFPSVRDGGVWKRFQLYTRVDGTWRRVLLAVNSGGTWKKEEE